MPAPEPTGPVPVATWGPRVWGALHALAFAYRPEQVFEHSGAPDAARRKQAWVTILSELPYVLPCPSCAQHFWELLADPARPIDGAIGLDNASRGGLARWMYDTHNLVTARVWQEKRGDQRTTEAIVRELETTVYPYDAIMKQYCDTREGATACPLLTQPYIDRNTGALTCATPAGISTTMAIAIILAVTCAILAAMLRQCRQACGGK